MGFDVQHSSNCAEWTRVRRRKLVDCEENGPGVPNYIGVSMIAKRPIADDSLGPSRNLGMYRNEFLRA